MSFRVGLTGGIASGKSTVCQRFADLGVSIVDADRIAHQVVAAGSSGLASVVAEFGEAILDGSGRLDRAAMRRRVFSDPSARQQLEAIVHPLVREQMQQEAAAAPGPYCILDIPLLVETGDAATFDRVLVVDVPVAMQRYRLRQRDGADDSAIDDLLAAQASRQQRLAVADDVVDNSGSLEDTWQQIDRLHQRYLHLAGARSTEVAT